MQDRYTGDIGDFGKLGFLRILQASGFSIGVNWYLVADEIHNNDGRHVQYLNDEHIFRCDEPLRNELKRIVESGQREVSALEHELILKACFYSAPLVVAGKTKSERVVARNEWHKEALRCFSGLDLVFVDPDNGILVPSAAETLKENKYVKFEELADYYWQGSTVIYYQHKARRPDRFYTYQHRQLIENMKDSNASGFGLKFCKTSQRYFFFIVHSFHREAVSDAVQKLLSSAWNEFFELLPCKDR